MTSSKPSYLPKVPPPDTITWGVGLQHMNLGGGPQTLLLHSINDIILESLVMLGIFFAFFSPQNIKFKCFH